MSKKYFCMSICCVLVCLCVGMQSKAKGAAFTYNLLDESEAVIDRSRAEQTAWDTFCAHQDIPIRDIPISCDIIIPNQWLLYSHYIRVPELANPVWFVSVLHSDEMIYWMWKAAVAVDGVTNEIVFYSETLEYGLQGETEKFLVAEDDEYGFAKIEFLVFPPNLFGRVCVPDIHDISKTEALHIATECLHEYTGEPIDIEKYLVEYELITYSELCDERIWKLYFTNLEGDHSTDIYDYLCSIYASHAKVWYLEKLADDFVDRPPLDRYDYLYVDNQYCKKHIDKTSLPLPGLLLTGLDKVLQNELYEP